MGWIPCEFSRPAAQSANSQAQKNRRSRMKGWPLRATALLVLLARPTRQFCSGPTLHALTGPTTRALRSARKLAALRARDAACALRTLARA